MRLKMADISFITIPIYFMRYSYKKAFVNVKFDLESILLSERRKGNGYNYCERIRSSVLETLMEKEQRFY